MGLRHVLLVAVVVWSAGVYGHGFRRAARRTDGRGDFTVIGRRRRGHRLHFVVSDGRGS